MRIVFFLAIVALTALPAFSQSSYLGAGSTYVVAFPDTLRTLPGPLESPDEGAWLVLVSETDATARVRGPGIDRTVSVAAGVSSIVPLRNDPAAPIFLDRPGVVVPHTFRVDASAPIVVHAYFRTAFGSEAFTPLPVERWGDRYAVASFFTGAVFHVMFDEDEEYGVTLLAPGQFGVVAAYDGTTVTIAGAVDTTITLRAGEACLFEPERVDPSGTRISATRPVGVISGSTRQVADGGATPGGWVNGNSLKNVAVEWLAPIDLHGTEFHYQPVAMLEGEGLGEVVKVIAAETPTRVRSTDAPADTTLAARRSIAIDALDGRRRNVGPIDVTTDRPAQAFVLVGHAGRPISAPQGGYVEARTWGTALAELVPPERWGRFARFHAPAMAPGLSHVVAITPDAGARVWLDGVEVAMTPHAGLGRPVAHARVAIAAGDHRIVSSGGDFTAIVHGSAPGYEAYRPPIARGEDAPDGVAGAAPLHPSTYTEILSVSYAYPTASLPYGDSLAVVRIDSCGRTSVAVTHEGHELWTGRDLTIGDVSARVNVGVDVEEIRAGGVVAGYRIEIAPVDRDADASADLAIASASGVTEIVRYRHVARPLRIAPAAVAIGPVLPGVERATRVVVTNVTDAPLAIDEVRLAIGRELSIEAPPGAWPRTIASGDSLALVVRFTGAAADSTYRDTVIVSWECGVSHAPVAATTTAVLDAPVPSIDDLDWGGRRLSSIVACTKNDVLEYDTTIDVRNAGTVPFTIRAIELFGPDVARFDLDTTAPGSARHGAVVGGAPAGLPIRILFRPTGERSYSASLRVVTDGGDTVVARITGAGIESHVEVDPEPLRFGTVLIDDGGGVATRGTARVTAMPTRPVLVTSIAIVGDTAFAIDTTRGFVRPDHARPTTWWRLAPGEFRSVPILFAPRDTGAFVAFLAVGGDMSHCDDTSSALLGAASRGASAVVTGPPATLTCDESSGTVVVTNDGALALSIASVDVDGPIFSQEPALALPIDLDPGESVAIPIRFRPTVEGRADATMRVELRDRSGRGIGQGLVVPLAGDGAIPRMLAHVERWRRVPIGGRTLVPVHLDSATAGLGLDSLVVDVTWGSSIVAIAGVAVDGSLLEGWTRGAVTRGPQRLTTTLAAPGRMRLAPGVLFHLVVDSYLGADTATDVRVRLLTPSNGCVRSIIDDGRLAIDSICGLVGRLIEIFPVETTALRVHPNPASDVAAIELDLAVPGRVVVDIVDATGRPVRTLVDATLDAGRYDGTIDARALPAGTYLLRMRSGEVVRTEMLRIVR